MNYPEKYTNSAITGSDQGTILSEHKVRKLKIKHPFLLIFIVLLVGVSALGYYYREEIMNLFVMTDVQHTLTKIPYIGLHNNADVYRQPYALCDTGSSVSAVLEYWYPAQNDLDVVYNQYPFCVTENPEDVVTFVNSLETNLGTEYQASVQTLPVTEFHNYLNDAAKTPLLVYLPARLDQPSNLSYYPVALVKGIDTETKTLTLDSYWFGPNWKLSFAEYQKLQDSLPVERQNQIIVIEPKVRDNYTRPTLPASHQNLAEIPSLTDEQRQLFATMAAAEGAYNQEQFDLAKLHFQQMLNNPLFSTDTPLIMQVWELNRFADAVGNGLGEYQDALEILLYAEELNRNLDKPFRHFASYDYLLNNNNVAARDRLSVIHITKGDMYRKMDQIEEAIASYEEALDIYSGHSGPRRILEDLYTKQNDS